MKAVSYLIAGILGLLGLVFIIGAQGQVARYGLGAVLLIAAGVVVYLMQLRPQVVETRNVQQIDLSGDIALERLKCQNCASPLDKESLEVKAGAIFVHCPYCDTSYQLEEAPKW